MRLNGDPNFEIPWTGWAEIQRASVQMDKLKSSARKVVDEVKAEDGVDDQFDTTIVGPWMNNVGVAWKCILHFVSPVHVYIAAPLSSLSGPISYSGSW
jgi:hypothetical protein